MLLNIVHEQAGIGRCSTHLSAMMERPAAGEVTVRALEAPIIPIATAMKAMRAIFPRGGAGEEEEKKEGKK